MAKKIATVKIPVLAKEIYRIQLEEGLKELGCKWDSQRGGWVVPLERESEAVRMVRAAKLRAGGWRDLKDQENRKRANRARKAVRLADPSKPETDKHLNQAEVAAVLEITKRQVTKLDGQRGFPQHHIFRGDRRWLASAIKEWLQSQAVGAES